MNAPKMAFVHAPAIEALSYPVDCPFKTQRPTLTRQRLRSFGLLPGENRRETAARPATRAELERFHTAGYLDELQRAAAGDLTPAGFQMGLGGPDTPVFADLYEYGRWACGAGLVAADLLLTGQADVAFNLLGGFHHAMAARASGFCYLNDVVLACQRLAAAGRRVVCLDVDAHHGDGTQEAFYDRNDVFTISMHESGRTLFPWGGFENEVGTGVGTGFNLNVPLPAGTYDEAFLRAFDRAVQPRLEAFGPDVLVLELGMDTLAGDPLTHLSLTNNAVADLVERLRKLRVRRSPVSTSGKSGEEGEGDEFLPTLVVGGGGYHVEHTVRGWTLAWRAFAGEGDADIYSLGLGGVMMGSSEWAGGLRDPHRIVTPEQRAEVELELETTLARINRFLPLRPENRNPECESANVRLT